MEGIIYKIYQKIGDSLTRRQKQAFLLFLLIFGILVVYSYCYQIKTDYNVLYWTFSSIIQSLLALTALLVVGSIFKLQILHNREEKIVDEMRSPGSDFVYHTGRLNEVLTLHEILKEIERIKSKENKEIRRLEEIRQIGKDILRSKELTRNFTLKFAIYNSFVVGLALLFLIFTPLISNYYFGIPVLYLSGLLFIYSLFLAIKGITASLWQ